MKNLKNFITKIILFYQKNISPLLGKRCRFYPTCSEYYILALKKYSISKATFLFTKRILRCNPLFKGGVDLL